MTLSPVIEKVCNRAACSMRSLITALGRDGKSLPWMPIRPAADSPTLEKPAPQHASLQIVSAKESLRGGKTAVANVTSRMVLVVAPHDLLEPNADLTRTMMLPCSVLSSPRHAKAISGLACLR